MARWKCSHLPWATVVVVVVVVVVLHHCWALQLKCKRHLLLQQVVRECHWRPNP
jgi:hypothetical protein